jgi:uncharacterized protein YndB with AHSA1/START domain
VTAATELEPVVKTVEVNVPPERAFEVFTVQLGEWWPKASHSIGEEKVAAVVVEPGLDGRIFERWEDGTEYGWATFTVWDPPRRFVMSWRPSPTPGPRTEVEVTFSASGDATIVQLTHWGWERLGESAAELRRSYEGGWVPVLARYSEATA